VIEKNHQFRKYSGNSHTLIDQPSLSLDLKDTTTIFCTILWLSMMQHNTCLVTKGLAFKKLSSGKTFTKIMNLHFDLNLADNSPKDFKECRNIPSNQQSRRYSGGR